MAYGSVKVDTIIFDDNGSDQNVTVSGLYRATTSGVTLSGTLTAATVSGVTVIGSTTVSGATVTGTTANFTSGNFGDLNSAAATVSGSLVITNQQQVRFREAAGNGVNYIALQAPASVASDKIITLPDVTGTVVTTGDSGTVTSAMIADGTVVNADINASAAIALSKLATGALPSGITVASTNIVDGTIVNADINASAAIADTKLATISTAGKVLSSALPATISSSTTGNAASATTLATARTIGGVSFDGSTNINLPGVNTAGNQNTSGNAATATNLSSNRTFALTGDVTGSVSSNLSSGASISAAIAAGVIVNADISNSAAIAYSKLAALNSANILVGSSTNVPTARTVTGDVTIGNTGVTAIAAGVIVNADINASAAIAGTKISPDFGSQDITIGDKIIHAGDTNTAIRFPANDTVTVETSGVERLRVNSGGDILVGQTSTAQPGLGNTTVGMGYDASLPRLSGSRESGVFLLVNRNDNGDVIELRRSGSIRGTISVTTTSTAYNTSSDYRLKENIVSLDGAIARLNQLPVHRFNFIADPDTVVDGFIAHEAAAVVPECVTGVKDEVDEDGTPIYQGIDQSKVVPLLAAALQEAVAMINALEARIAALEA